MEACNIFCRVTELELMKNVVPNLPSCASGKSGDGAVGEMDAQVTQLAVLGAKLVTPLRNAMGLIDGEKCDGHALQPSDSVSPRQPFRRKIEQSVFAVARL